MKKTLLYLLFVTMFVSIHAQNTSLINVRANMEFLASDALMGREAGSEYEDITIEFLASELRKYGIKPFCEDGSYFQYFDVLKNRMEMDSKIHFVSGNSKSTIEPVKDFVGEIVNLNDDLIGVPTEMVFCGYGINDPESGYNDYEGLDVKGKIVVTTFGIPSSEHVPDLEGVNLNRFRSPAIKVQVAAKQGAEAVLFLPDELLDQMWGMLAQMTTESKFDLVGFPKENSFFPLPAIGLNEISGTKLDFDGKLTLDEIREKSKEGKLLERFVMNQKIILDLNMTREPTKCRNVIGVIEGDNKNEFVTIGAHYDHLGAIDSLIYNGADDNASGVSAILEAARKLKCTEGLKRSVIVVLFGAEEKGLLGSRYFANKWKEKENLLVNINIDMCGRENKDTLVVRGAYETSNELIELLKSVDNEAEIDFDIKKGLTDGMGSSDHASFAELGIPVVDLGDDMHKDLHTPNDVLEKINFVKVSKTAEAVYLLAMKVASLDHKLTRN